MSIALRRIKHAERALFQEILESKIATLQNEIAALARKIASPDEQLMLAGIGEEPRQLELKIESWRQQKREAETELSRLRDALHALRSSEKVPFVWDIAFVEIFEGEKRGFDIVIGNPPYVRQERIAPPTERPEEHGGEDSEEWKKLKKEYKAKLQHSVAVAWPRFFAYRLKDDKQGRKLDGKSDYYVYFYLHGLSLLNEKGSFCFITSNSWLDVGYGRDLQEFLLKHSQVKLILDNGVKRSFASSDVNTIIALLSPADDRKDRGLEETARFVMFKVPFEEILHPVIFEEIEEIQPGTRKPTPDYRAIAITQRELYKEGMALPEDEGKKTKKMVKSARYVGNKWGGKYLRAPDIFFTILEKGKGKLVRLGDIAEVRFGIKTGANEFFYLEPTGKPAPEGLIHVRNGAGWEGYLEEEFVKPFLFSLKEVNKYEIEPSSLKRNVLACGLSRNLLGQQGKKRTLEYIAWGEQHGFHKRPSVRGRRMWYELPDQIPPHFVSNRFLGERFGFPWIEDILVCDVFFVGRFAEGEGLIGTALLNSAVSFLFAEVLARKTYGIGVAYLYGPEIRGVNLLNPKLLNKTDRQRLLSAFGQMRRRNILRVEEEFLQPDHRALDEVVFDALGLTSAEREAVYHAVVELVKNRLMKARSV